MAVFEKEFRKRKIYLDDTIPLHCTFLNVQNIHGHIEYIIRVQRGPTTTDAWHIYKRYNDFVNLHHALQPSSLSLPLPPKKLIGNFDKEFIAERQAGLQKYINYILMNPILASSLPVKRFLDPDNYSSSFQETALQHVSMALRGELDYEMVKALSDIGWRLRKHYFQVKKRSNPKEELILSWVEYGPDKYLNDKELHAVLKGLATLQHPNIGGVEMLTCHDAGGYVVRRLNSEGSLRDTICHCKPRQTFLKKYSNPKLRCALPLPQVVFISTQILHGLRFLHEKGIPYGHLHLGNIMLENDVVKLVEIENGVLGLPSFYRPFFMQHRKISSLEAVDVYCFGHVLYEMTFGNPLHESVCDNLPPNCPPIIRPVLESILSSGACKSGMPSLEMLLALPVFSAKPATDHCYFKLSSHTRDALKDACHQTDARIKDEQKKVRHQKRLVKMQEVLNSEEDNKKDRKKHKVKREEKHVEGTMNGNGLSPERSDSPNSTSTATSAGTITPPSAVPPPPPPLTLNLTTQVEAVHIPQDDSRTALLGSICNFNKASLRRTKPVA
ncbi:PX domain-containing protein kinase-like protein [Homalodisca vitripennis]|uniref:PX domain-containing protein kinase-like protein n=1 Tax=Homalodisca vitripennis TaxID=197043 RepID=UPI001EEA60F9|nr:PX domain-containing protein kinase-like protein [Homalodisca vitripennis]